MPEIGQYYKQQRLSATAGNGSITSGDIQQITAPYREMARAGNVLTDFGMKYMKLDEQVRYHDELNKAQVDSLRQFDQFSNSLNDNSDTSTYAPEFKNLTNQIRAGVKFTNERAANDYQTWLNRQELSWNNHVNTRRWRVDARNYEKNFNLNVVTTRDLAANALNSADYVDKVTDGAALYGVEFENDPDGRPMLDKPRLIENWNNPLLDSPAVRMTGFNAWKARVDSNRVKNIMQNDALTVGWDKAEGLLTDPAYIKKVGGNLDDAHKVLDDVKAMHAAQVAQQQEELKSQQQKDLDAIGNAFSEKQYNIIPTLIDNSHLDLEQKTVFKKSLTEIGTEPGFTDERTRGDFETMALNIPNGSVTRSDFNNRLLKARYVYKTINDPAYKDLRKLGAEKFQNYQADAVKEAFDYGRGQLVTVDENMLASLLSVLGENKTADAEKSYQVAADRRKFELDNFAEYKQSLTSWLGKNPEANADDVYIQSRRLRAIYYGKSLTDIQKTITTREAQLAVGAGQVSKRNPGESVADYMKRTGQK